jgi:hypothetical protein
MRLNEITRPLPPEIMEEAFDLIYEYVTHGEVHGTAHEEHFDRSFERLLQLLPRPEKGLRLFRAMRLTDEQVATLRTGRRVVLQPRRFMSWTKDAEVAERIAWGKGRTGHPIIVTRHADAAHIVVDVMRFYQTYDMKDESYFNYVRREREVIVMHDAPLILTKTNTRLLERANILPPKPGDMVFMDEDENPYEVVAVPDYQPETSNGVFTVKVRYMDKVVVRPIMVNGEQADGEWETLA